jgi:hypothetical protein
MNELPPLPANLPNVVRRIRDCKGEIAAQVVFEHALNEYAREAIEARRGVPAERLTPVIQWLEAGCDPKHAATELQLLASATTAPQHENETINKLRAGYPAAIDAAIREQASVLKQEPVAEITKAGENVGVVEWLVHSGRPIRVGQALYTHPAPVREPLTNDQIDEIAGPADYFDRRVFARAIEAAHGITKDTP